jgi:response regulator NasT
MQTILIIDNENERASWLKASLELSGFTVLPPLCWQDVNENRLRETKVDVILVDTNAPERDTLEHISLMSGTLEKPVVVLGGKNDPAHIQSAIRAGVSAYITHHVAREDLSGIIQVASARFAEFKRLRDELRHARQELVERKSIEQAKGILMTEQRINEPEAHARMRKLAMNKGKRMAEIAEAIILAHELENPSNKK